MGGVFIEADPNRYQDLQKNYLNRTGIICINSSVMPEGENSLSNIIDRTPYAQKNPMVLSIDIDSDDLAVWKGFNRYQAFLVIIEYNPTIPSDVYVQNPKGRQIGNSALAIYEYATSAGYVFVAQNETNLVFIDQSRLPNSIPELDFFDTQKVNGVRYFWGYDGTLYRHSLTEGFLDVREDEIYSVPWTPAFMAQPVPRFFRKWYRKSRTIYLLMTICMAVLLSVNRPLTVFSMIIKKKPRLSRIISSLFNKSSQAESKV